MPIDKSQSVGGMCAVRKGYSSDKPFHYVGANIDIVESDPAFVGWTKAIRPEWARLTHPPKVRDDYQVNDDGKLIRLGDQIDEELYPAVGLFVCSFKRPQGFKLAQGAWVTVAEVEGRSWFDHWADTPKNRELGLYKPEEKKEMPQTEIKVKDRVRWVAGPLHRDEFEGEATVVLVGYNGALRIYRVDSYALVVRDDECFGGGPNGEWVVPMACLEKIGEFPFKVGDRVIHAIEGPGVVLADPDQVGDYSVKLDSGQEGGAPGGGWYCKPHRLRPEKLAKVMKFKIGDRVKVVRAETSAIASLVGDKGRVVKYIDDNGDREYSVRLDGNPTRYGLTANELERDPRKVIKKGKKSKNGLSAADHQKMVSEQSKSLAGGAEVTAWLKVRIPGSGNGKHKPSIWESPMPDPKDGWVETHTERFQPYEALCAGVPSPSGGEEPFLVCVHSKWRDKTPYELLFTHEAGQCWVKEMGVHVYNDWNVAGIWKKERPCVLEFKLFRREPKPNEDWRRMTMVNGYTSYAIDVPSDCSPDHYDTARRGQIQQATAIQHPNPNWPDDGHPGLTANDGGTREKHDYLPSLNHPEPPREKYDDAYWPERHAPKVK